MRRVDSLLNSTTIYDISISCLIVFKSIISKFQKSSWSMASASAVSLESISMTTLNNLSRNHHLHRSSLLGFSRSFQNLGISSNGPDFFSRSRSTTPKNLNVTRAFFWNWGKKTEISRPSKFTDPFVLSFSTLWPSQRLLFRFFS